MKEAPAFAAYVGIDWGDKKHDLCLWVPGTEKRERSVLEHTPKALQAWAKAIRERFGGEPVAVCMECSEGPLVSALLEHDCFVIYPVQPATLARYRKAFKTSGAKDDPTDAEFALELMLRHPEKLTRLEIESAPMRSLRTLVEVRRSLFLNRPTNALKEYFPQALDWFRDKDTDIFITFLERWSTLQAAQRARRETLVEFFHSGNVRYKSVVERRIQAIRDEVPLTTDRAVIEPMQLLVERLVPLIRSLNESIARFDAKIESVCQTLADYHLFAELPGAGPTLAPRLLAAFGERRERFRSAAALQKYAGVAPVTERSGNKSWVHWRLFCPKFLRQTFVEWAGQTVPRSFWAAAHYRSCRARGMRHQAALRSLAFKWIRVLYRCWVERKPYDESRYLLALQKRHAPLLKFAADNPS